jgi:hypothetical protein
MASGPTFSIVDRTPGGAALFTIPGGIGLYREAIELGFSAEVGKGFTAQIMVRGASVRIGANGDGFLEQLVPGAQDSQAFDFGLAWDSQRGLSFAGSAALEVTLPLRAKLPLVSLQALHLGLKAPGDGGSDFALSLSADLTGSLAGLIEVSVERIGLEVLGYYTGNVAPKPDTAAAVGSFVTLAPRFKPPSGAGLSLDLGGVISGGGFLSIDPDKGQYAGLLSLNLIGLGVTAIGIVNTKPAFSLLAVITANFRPVGLDIGFGFTINAVGGLLGLHRSVDAQALRESVRTNAIQSLLFPPNPVADAPRIISDMARVFPPVQGHFLVGPMIEMGWGKPAGMIALQLGVIVEVPEPRIAILGVLRVLVPPDLDFAIVRIQVNFLGLIDFPQRFISFDASLFDSRLAQYTLEGDMAARLRWGAGATFAVTVGGFHPKYVAAADLQITAMRRVAINLLPTTDNPRLRVESYYAATSNTLQHGASMELYAAAAGFGIRGHLGYDLIAQLSPFQFSASFGASVAVIAFDEEIFSVGLDLQLSGPTPWRIDGEASFKIFLKRVRIPVHEQFGPSTPAALPDVDVAAKLREQIAQARNWTATLPGQNALLVQLTPKLKLAEGEVLAHPSATLEFNQRAIPLQLQLQRFGAAQPKGDTLFDLVALQAGAPLEPEPLTAEFAPAQFRALSDDDRISAPAFELHKSGLRANPAALVSFSAAVSRDFGYESGVRDAAALEIAVDVRRRSSLVFVDKVSAQQALGGSALARSALYQERVDALPSPQQIRPAAGGFAVVNADTFEAVAATPLGNHSLARQAMDDLVAKQPALAGKLLVVAQAELAEATA